MAQTYSSKGKVFLTQHQFDSRKDAGTLQNGVEYMIIDDPNTIDLSDGSISLLASNGVMIIGKSSEEPYLTIGTGNQVLVDTPTVERQVANKKYVDDGLANKQNKLKATNPIYISDDGGTISLNFGNGLYVNTNSSNNLDVDWSRISIASNSPLYFDSCNNKGLNISVSSPLYANSYNLGINYGHGLNKISVTDSNGEVTSTVLGVACDSSSPLYINDSSKLSVDINAIASNIAGSGLSYNNTTKKLDTDTYTKETYGDFIFPPNQLTTIRAKISDSGDASRIKFNGTYWIELSYCNGYAWGMTSSNGYGDYFTYSALKVNATTTSNCTIVSTTDEATSCNYTAFVTTTIIK